LPDTDTLQKLGNGLLFNISWLAIVSSQSTLIAVAVVVVHLTIHMLWMGRGGRELLFIAALSLFGAASDHILFALGVFNVNGQPAAAPIWLSCLWPVLATTLAHAFSVLQQRLLLASVLGAIGGFASYSAGTAMSAVGFADPLYGPVLIAALWAILFPALALAARLTFAHSDHAADRA